jgi:hypothetical protein
MHTWLKCLTSECGRLVGCVCPCFWLFNRLSICCCLMWPPLSFSPARVWIYMCVWACQWMLLVGWNPKLHKRSWRSEALRNKIGREETTTHTNYCYRTTHKKISGKYFGRRPYGSLVLWVWQNREPTIQCSLSLTHALWRIWASLPASSNSVR